MNKEHPESTIAEKIAARIARLRKKSDCGRVFPCGVEVRETPYGFGVFSCAFIPAGTPIGRVRGFLVQDADYSSDYCITAGDDLVLEPGAPFCYLNHSCEPNSALMHYVSEEEYRQEQLEKGEIPEEHEESEEEELEAARRWSLTKDDPFGIEDEEEGRVLTLGEEDEDEECVFGDGGAADASGEEDWDEEECDENCERCENRDECEWEEEEESETGEQTLRSDDEGGIEIWLESTKDIFPGEQLCIDYAWTSDRAMRCLCGAKTCRGWIVDPAELDELLENNPDER